MAKIKIGDLRASVLENKPRTEQADILLTYLLDKIGALNYEQSKYTADVITANNELRLKHPNIIYLSEASISNYLSVLSRNSNSRISCMGKKQGYFLAEEVVLHEEISLDAEEDSRSMEYQLYPYLVEWMESNGYSRAKDISSSRRRQKWGNPDIIGINVVNILGGINTEIATIEAKRDNSFWRKDIFEAVAHTLFSNRVYYAYCRKESEKDDSDMIEYALKFNIGILAIIVPDDQYGKEFDPENAEVRVVVPAPFQSVSAIQQKQFLELLNLNEIDKLLS